VTPDETPGETPEMIATKTQDTLSGIDRRSCAKLQPHPFNSFGEVSLTDRQTDGQLT